MPNLTVPFPLSPSRMSLAACPLALANRNNKVKKDAPTSDFLTLGSEGHAVFEAINVYTGKFTDEFIDSVVAKHVVHSDPILVRRWAKLYIYNFPTNETCGTEIKLGLTRDLKPCAFNSKYVAWRCIIDAILPDKDNPHAVTIIDNKTSFAMYKPDTFQLKFYMWILNRCFPDWFEIRAGIYFARYGRLMINDFVTTEFADVERGIIAQSEGIWGMDLSNPKPKAGTTCTICDYCMTCPLTEAKVNAITNDKEALEAAQAYIAKTKQVSVLKSKLSKWTDTHGEIKTNDNTMLGFTEATRRSVDVRELLKYVDEYPELVDTMSASAKKVLKILPDFPIIVTPHTTFKPHAINKLC